MIALPSAKARSTLSRQWELLQQLPKSAPGITVSELLIRLNNAGYSIGRRSVERDLNDLSLTFPLQCNSAGTPQGWYWKPGVSVELQGVSLTEAISLALVEDAVRPLLPASMLSVLQPRFAHARSKLKELSDDNPAARWLDKIASIPPALNLQAPHICPRILETLQSALLGEQQLQCSYYAVHADKTSDLTLNPLAMVQRGQVTYLIATAPPYTDIRQYAAHRFLGATTLETSTQGAQAFDLKEYLDSDALQFGTPQKINFKAWLSQQQGRLIRETPLAPDMRMIEVEDGWEVFATLNNTWQLHWWILSLGEQVVVHEPASLRQHIGNMLRRAAAAYEETPIYR